MADSDNFTLRKRLCINNEPRSLQDVCRRTIIKSLTLENVQQVSKLPLPSVIKDYLFTFHIPMDFDLDGVYMDYNFNFPNHVHHCSHQIHPGKCVLDGSKVLIKSENVNVTCKVCQVMGKLTMHCEKEREKWAGLFHDNLMNCLFGICEPQNQRYCHVFDFPLMNLEDFVIKMFLSREKLPEEVVWLVLQQLVDLLMYLDKNDIHPWELCQPQHVIISETGKLKMENMLLYLPVKSGSHFNTDVTTTSVSKYTSPEQLKGHAKGPQTVIWGLGCILRELCMEVPTALSRLETGFIFPPITLKTGSCFSIDNRYSPYLHRTITDCLMLSPSRRPNLKNLKKRTENFLNAGKNIFQDHSNAIAKSILDFLPN